MEQQRTHQKKSAAPTRTHPTKTSVKSPVHPVEELQAAIGNREMGRLMETNRLPHPSSPFPKLQGELPLLGGMMPVSQGTIQRQPLFRGLSQELTADTAMALPATGAVIQPKLTLGTPGDMYEQEADSVARQVVDEIHSSPFREPNTLSPGERKPDGGEALRVQRQITVRAAGDAGGELSSEWEGELQRAKSGGQPLSPSVKEPMERAFGADFGGVRVHTGEQADRLARAIQAKAFTTGQDVFFRQGEYKPGSRGGKELIAHELTHVEQQKAQTDRKNGKQEANAIQRKIYVGGVEKTNYNKMWQELKTIVWGKSVRGGLKVLRAMHLSNKTYNFVDGYELAKKIEEELKTETYEKHIEKMSDARRRPGWWKGIKETYSDTHGGSYHRRHIVMSSLMKTAIYRVTDKAVVTGKEKDCIEAYGQLVTEATGITLDLQTVEKAESALVEVVHNNPGNLVLDEGMYNSAIGAYAHNVEFYLNKSEDEIESLIEEVIKEDTWSFLTEKLTKGFEKQIQKYINEVWLQYIEELNPFEPSELKAVLQDMYDNAALDLLLTTQTAKDYKLNVQTLIEVHQELTHVEELDDLKKTIKKFIELGNNSSLPITYKQMIF
jgi:hypothetical protein